MASFPDVPTLMEQGYNIVAFSNYFIIGRKGFPKDRMKILHDAFYEGLQNPGFKKALAQIDMEMSYKDYENSKNIMMDIFQSSGKIIEKIEKK